MYRFVPLLIATAFLVSFSYVGKSYAGAGSCIAGLPCITNLTANDPQDATDGPNYTGPNAPKSELDSCSADFMNQVFGRAYIEANREIMIAGGLVARPDSVLEYTCFDERAQEIISTAGPIFTGSSRWGPAQVPVPSPDPGPIQIQVSMGTNKLQAPIQQLVIQSLGAHTGNFPSTFLGGTPGGPSKSCGIMDSIFRAARCDNANKTLHFMSFSDIVGSDPRNIAPSAGTCSNNPITSAMVSLANNDSGTHAHKDDAVTYLEFVAIPPSSATSCADAIPTGLMVIRDTSTTGPTGIVTKSTSPAFEDKICSTPGCYFPGGTGTTCSR